jgi:predicted O-methyltransferase YrrM
LRMDHASTARSTPQAAPQDRRADRRDVEVRWLLPWHQLRRAVREPGRLSRLHHASVLASLRSLGEPTERRFLADYLGLDGPTLQRFEADLVEDVDFVREIERRHRDVRKTSLHLLGGAGGADHDRCHRLLYYCARALRPAVVVETGVFDGFSSAFLLKALRDNGRGRLCSIDLPARAAVRASTDKMLFDRLPAGAEPGWIVPEGLRSCWELRLGTSRAVLGPWLAELGTIDLFFHDSLHSFENMTWEYSSAWPALAAGGLLLSDDVFWSRAFRRFARKAGGGERVFRGMGFLRKWP